LRLLWRHAELHVDLRYVQLDYGLRPSSCFMLDLLESSCPPSTNDDVDD
jgi:hypothetical protein